MLDARRLLRHRICVGDVRCRSRPHVLFRHENGFLIENMTGALSRWARVPLKAATLARREALGGAYLGTPKDGNAGWSGTARRQGPHRLPRREHEILEIPVAAQGESLGGAAASRLLLWQPEELLQVREIVVRAISCRFGLASNLAAFPAFVYKSGN